MANNARVLGIVLMHATGTTAGLFETLKDKVCTYCSHFISSLRSRHPAKFSMLLHLLQLCKRCLLLSAMAKVSSTRGQMYFNVENISPKYDRQLFHLTSEDTYAVYTYQHISPKRSC